MRKNNFSVGSFDVSITYDNTFKVFITPTVPILLSKPRDPQISVIKIIFLSFITHSKGLNCCVSFCCISFWKCPCAKQRKTLSFSL